MKAVAVAPLDPQPPRTSARPSGSAVIVWPGAGLGSAFCGPDEAGRSKSPAAMSRRSLGRRRRAVMVFCASRERDAQVHAAGVGPRWIEHEGVSPVLQRRAHREGRRALLGGAHARAWENQNQAAATDRIVGAAESHDLTGR